MTRGVRGGQVIGRTNACGEEPKERPIWPEEVLATVTECVRALGTYVDRSANNRP